MNRNDRVIVIGASTGGVDALQRLASKWSSSFPAPVLVVLHIGGHRSRMPELLNAAGPMRAVTAEAGMVPEPGRIYMAPSDRHLLLEEGRLQLTGGPKEHHTRPAIDPLFRSAALDVGTRAVGVVLTGLLDDGSAGLRAIQACGGTTVVQDPDDAVEPSMPSSALSNLVVDHVLMLDTMANELERLAKPLDHVPPVSAPEWLRTEHAISLGKGSVERLAEIGFPSALTCPDCGGALFEINEGKPRFLCHTGHAFSLRSFAAMQGQLTDHALWSALRALEEKELVLRRLAELQRADHDGLESASLTEAAMLRGFIAEMRLVVRSAPPESPTAERVEEADT